MSEPVTVADLRASMAIVDRHPGSNTEAWRERAHAQHVLADWRAWLPGLLDQAEAKPSQRIAGYDSEQGAAVITIGLSMTQAEAEARGLV